jgi:DNA-binding CsgD family transcriptional regulator
VLGELPDSVQLAAYRIMQESLTNVVRHAGQVRAEVRLDRTDDELTVSILNAPGSTAADVRGGRGPGWDAEAGVDIRWLADRGRDERWRLLGGRPHPVRCAGRGDALLAPAITRRLIEEFVRRPAPGSTKPDMLDPLTDRECEVLVDIARGRSNSEIASLLFLSEATVKTHVTRILTKLGLRDRTQAVVLAYESGLVRAGERDGQSS